MTGRVTKDKKTNTYYYTIEVGTKVKRKRKVQKNFKTKTEAKKVMDLAMDQFEKEGNLENSNRNMTLGDYLDYWLKPYAKTNTAPTTYRGYEGIIRVHLKPELGQIKLLELTSLQIQDYYTEKLEDLSAHTIKHHHRLLCKTLNDAVDWEILNRNVAQKAKPPKPEKFRPVFYSKEELNLLFEAAKASAVYQPIIYTAGHTGARLGELRALEWSDVDFERRKIAITKSAYQDKEGKLQIRDLQKEGKTVQSLLEKALCHCLKVTSSVIRRLRSS